ncbi:hypothetical protein [Gordonia zhaorongruii]|uniref:hypothetical protein n=1 Tax=Gordonia zhaorongruii TaxID=2597659 RepID=UPI001047DCCE|nr:hypothetical protein [Gordonia zhaorongruii]
MSAGRSTTHRTRGGVVGGSSTLTAIAAHAAAQGTLPETGTLLIVLAVGVAIGATVSAAPRLPSVPALVLGQGAVHTAMVLVTGHHHDMFEPRMLVTHFLGLLAALCLIAAVNALASLVIDVVVRVVSSTAPRTADRRSVTARTASPSRMPDAVLIFGSVGLRAPPLSV